MITAAFVRITWPNGQSDTVTYEQFHSRHSRVPNEKDRQAILDKLHSDGFVVLTNSKYPGKEIRIELTQSQEVN